MSYVSCNTGFSVDRFGIVSQLEMILYVVSDK